ncbi:MAG: SRPBCC domain-containing protein [Patescibacteria group bacterium]
MTESITVSAILPATPQHIYDAWLSSDGHSDMTGAHANIHPGVGGTFTAWDGYIEGTTRKLIPNERIVQSWRTSEFPEDAPDSKLEIVLEEVKGKAKITLHHTNIPKGQGRMYKEGWTDHYFEPMKSYFRK